MSSRMSDRSDHTLLSDISESDPNALNVLFNRYYPRLCDFALHYLKDLDRTEEVVSEVFVNLWIKRESLVITRNVKSYLFTATRNRALNQIDKDTRRNRHHVWIDEVELKSSEQRPDRSIQIEEFNEAIDQLLEYMPPRQKEIFKLSRIDGFTYKEISKILSISVHTIQNHMVQAVRDLEMIKNEMESRF
ncbi:MAG: RNA polymerase sigma-70 factor [Bacteroidota bacterium]